MNVSKNTIVFIVSIAAGLVLGIIGGPAIILLPWALVSLVIGVFSVGNKSAIINGSVFGFAAAFMFMISGYAGQAAIVTRLLPFAILGLVGAIYGLVFSFVGNVIYRRIRREK